MWWGEAASRSRVPRCAQAHCLQHPFVELVVTEVVVLSDGPVCLLLRIPGT